LHHRAQRAQRAQARLHDRPTPDPPGRAIYLDPSPARAAALRVDNTARVWDAAARERVDVVDAIVEAIDRRARELFGHGIAVRDGDVEVAATAV